MHSEILESLLVATHRLTREAAVATGTSTPSSMWRTLAVLETAGPHRVGELAVAARISQPGMTKVVADLAERDLVARIADVDDARAWLIRITPKGRAALAEYRRLLAETMQPRFGDLSEAEWRTLRSAAAILSRTLSDAAGAA